MFADTICKKASELVKRFNTRDPFEIANEVGIKVIPMYELDKLKGMYSVIKRNRIIILNGNLLERTQKTVCAHELGHDMLHREFAKQNALKEFMLYDMKNRPEYEANIFAADLLLDDDEVYSLAKDGYDMEQVAAILHTDINLMGLKMANMNYRGYDFRIGIEPKHNFLAD